MDHQIKACDGSAWVSTLEDLEFAGDIALLTHRLQDIRCKIENLDATGEKVGLKLNVPNAKLIKVMTKQDGAVNIGQESVEEVEKFQCLPYQ